MNYAAMIEEKRLKVGCIVVCIVGSMSVLTKLRPTEGVYHRDADIDHRRDLHNVHGVA